MDSIFLDIFKISPVLGVMTIMWFYQRKDYNKSVEDQRKDYTKLVEDNRIENKEREKAYQNTIDKLADKFEIIKNVQTKVDDIEKDVSIIKDSLSSK